MDRNTEIRSEVISTLRRWYYPLTAPLGKGDGKGDVPHHIT
jgi:hypothetical protein